MAVTTGTSGHRWFARLHGEHRGRDARHSLPATSAPRWAIPTAIGYQRLNRRQPRDLFGRHGGFAKPPNAWLCQLRERAALLWDIDAGSGGLAERPCPSGWLPTPATSSRCRWLTSRQKSAQTGGPIAAQVSVNAQGAAPAFATHVCDVEVDDRDRTCGCGSVHGGTGCRARDPPRLRRRARCRAASRKASAGRSTRNTSSTPSGRLGQSRASWTTACRWLRICR